MSTNLNVTVADIDIGTVTLASPDHQLFQVPTSILPEDIAPGNILRLHVSVDHEQEVQRRQKIFKLLDDVAIHIRSMRGKSGLASQAVTGRTEGEFLGSLESKG